MESSLSTNTLRFCLICFMASGCAPGSGAQDSKTRLAASMSMGQPVVDQEVVDALEAHGFAAVHIRVFPERLGMKENYTSDELSKAFNALLPEESWEQIGMVRNQPEFLGYLSWGGMRVLRDRGVAEFVARGDRVDEVLN